MRVFLRHDHERKRQRGFTVLELLIVIAIIGILTGIVLFSLDRSRAGARDAERLSDMNQIQIALELYYQEHGRYPQREANECHGYGVGNQDNPLLPNELAGLMDDIRDPSATGCEGYRYYRYAAGLVPGCDSAFYVLGITDMETVPTGTNHLKNPGWKCGTFTGSWDSVFEWYTGKLES